MNEQIIHFAIMLLWSICVAGIVWHFGKAAIQITYTTLADGRKKEKKLPFFFRILFPFTPMLIPFFKKPQFKKKLENVFKKLTSSGYDDIIKPEEFMAIRVLMPLVAGPAIILLAAMLLSLGRTNLSATRQIVFFTALLGWSLLYPGLWLNQAIALRHRSIVKALPFVMDLLTLSVEAGMDFMAAIRSIIDRRPADPIGEELGRVLFEIQLGKTRREALRAMAGRINHGDISSLVTALVQADELGVSIGAILRIQSDQIRTKRFMRAEKLANEAPVKLLFPLLACIFPAVILILLGPIFLQIIQHGF